MMDTNVMSESDKTKLNNLQMILSIAVPLWAIRVKENPDYYFDKARYEILDTLLEHGDALMYRRHHRYVNEPDGTKKMIPGSAEVFNATAQAIATLSFCPGGIDIFGAHFENKLNTTTPNIVKKMKAFFDLKDRAIQQINKGRNEPYGDAEKEAIK